MTNFSVSSSSFKHREVVGIEKNITEPGFAYIVG